MRLIDAEELKNAIMHKTGVANETWDQLYDSVLEEIDNAPTVEPQKVLVANVTFDKEQLEQLVRDRVIEPIKNGKLVLQTDERPHGEWIPVDERLPEDRQRVLIWFEYYRYGDFNCMYQTYGFGYVCDGKWSPFINGETGWQDYRVIAWQPLPEPYGNPEQKEDNR